MTPDLERKIAAAADKQFQAMVTSAFGAVTTTAFDQASGEVTLTVAKLEDMMAKLPPRETWVVSSLLAAPGQPMICHAPDERITAVHPEDWPHVDLKWRAMFTPEQRAQPWFGLNEIWLDPRADDSPEAAVWRTKERARVHGLIAATMAAHVRLHELLDNHRSDSSNR